MFIVTRLFFSVDAGSKTRFSPQNFVDFVMNGLTGCYQAGVRYFEVHNEPNLDIEGMSWNWANGAEFGSWLTQVINLLKPRFPEARWGYPGLSPQPNVDAFLDGSAGRRQRLRLDRRALLLAAAGAPAALPDKRRQRRLLLARQVQAALPRQDAADHRVQQQQRGRVAP